MLFSEPKPVEEPPTAMADEPVDTTDTSDRPESPSKKQATETKEPPKHHHDCCICGQNAPSTAERPFGYVVLLQASGGKLLMWLYLFNSQFIVLFVQFSI